MLSLVLGVASSFSAVVKQVIPLRLDSSAVVYEGDFVVHLERGVCQYSGRWESEEEPDERPVLLKFADRVVAVRPSEASKLSLLKRGFETANGGEVPKGVHGLVTSRPETPDTEEGMPKLSKLARPKAWLGYRRKALEASREHAKILVTMAAARSKIDRVPCQPLAEVDKSKLKSGLGFELTEGQLQCVADVEEDMCRRQSPMDRLVFGDVGYGKTEVAMRAILMAVRSGRQAALVAPTTILAAQHMRTIKKRLGELNVTVELLLGKTGSKDGKRIRQGMASGSCDVVIGTHAVLSKRLKWHNLGLVVVDEEQRFGVAQKEALKESCLGVDVLTLSATPIPRTLGAALAGIRDVSELPKPPPGRGFTKTRVVPDDAGHDDTTDSLLTKLFAREVRRGGQCFYVVPHIRDIPQAVERVQRLLQRVGFQEANILIAHGQMSDASDVILKFANGTNVSAPVLIATSLIENGIDLPRVNTIVVQDSHRFGLASLHQLRGRVGRSTTDAYALFLHPQPNLLTRSARDRLFALNDVRHQAGPELARRDLEIRGAGALFGTKQSGKVSRWVGHDLYTKMLHDELCRLRALDITPAPHCSCDLPNLYVDAHPSLEGADIPRVQALVDEWRGQLTPERKLAIKKRLLECHAARLGFTRVALLDDYHSDVAASGAFMAPNMDPATWTLVKREIPDHLQRQLVFDEITKAVHVVRLAALEPPKQLDFLLDIALHMSNFVDRIAYVADNDDVDDSAFLEEEVDYDEDPR